MYYKKEGDVDFSIPLKGVLGIEDYPDSKTLKKTYHNEKSRAKKRDKPLPTTFHNPPAAPLLLTHKRARDDDAPSPADRSKASRMAPKARGQAVASSQRPTRAAAAKAIEKFGGDDEDSVGEDDEGDAGESEEDADESEGSVSVESEGSVSVESESDEPKHGRKRKAAATVRSGHKSARGAAKMAVPTAAVRGVPVVPPDQRVEGLAELLVDAKSTDKLATAEAWCIEQGADSVADLAGYESDFIAHLALPRIKTDKLRTALKSRLG